MGINKYILVFLASVLCVLSFAQNRKVFPLLNPYTFGCPCFTSTSSLATNLTAFWPLTEVGPGDRADLGPNVQTLSDNNNDVLSVTDGLCGRAADFERDTPGQYLFRTDDATLSVGDIDFTFSWQARIESITANQQVISKGDISTTFEYAVRIFSTGGSNVWRFDINDNAGHYGGVNSAVAVATNQWYRGIVWHDSTNNTVNIRIAGEATQTSSYTFGSWDSTYDFRVGAGSILPEDDWDGQIGYVGFWKRILTTQEQDLLLGLAHYCP